MTNKKSFIILTIFAIFLVLALSSVIALKMPRGWKMDVERASLGSNESSNETIGGNNPHNESDNETHHGHNNPLNKTREMNYGRCVSNESKIKNTCYKEVKQVYKDCRFLIRDNTALNKTDLKEGFKICRETFKLEIKQCKADFKLAKEDCKQYKRFFNSTKED